MAGHRSLASTVYGQHHSHESSSLAVLLRRVRELHALQQNASLPDSTQRSLAFQQWAQCNVLEAAIGEELCAGRPASPGGSGESLSAQSGSTLLQALLGNASAADAQCAALSPVSLPGSLTRKGWREAPTLSQKELPQKAHLTQPCSTVMSLLHAHFIHRGSAEAGSYQ